MASTSVLNEAKGLLTVYPEKYSDDVPLVVKGVQYPTTDAGALGLLFSSQAVGNLAAFLVHAGAMGRVVEHGEEWEDEAARVADLTEDEVAILFAPFGSPRPGESRKAYQVRESISRINQVLAKYADNSEALGNFQGLLEQINSLRVTIEVTSRLANDFAFTSKYQGGDVMAHLGDCDVFAARASMALRDEIDVLRRRLQADKAAG